MVSRNAVVDTFLILIHGIVYCLSLVCTADDAYHRRHLMPDFQKKMYIFVPPFLKLFLTSAEMGHPKRC